MEMERSLLSQQKEGLRMTGASPMALSGQGCLENVHRVWSTWDQESGLREHSLILSPDGQSPGEENGNLWRYQGCEKMVLDANHQRGRGVRLLSFPNYECGGGSHMESAD